MSSPFSPRLRDRLARLEANRVADGGNEMPPVLLGALLQAIAILLGGYPRPSPTYGAVDTFGDAFARAVGYADREALEAAMTDEPDQWSLRVAAANERLLDDMDIDREKTDADPAMTAWSKILDVVAAAKAEGAPWRASAAADLAKWAMTRGVPTEARPC